MSKKLTKKDIADRINAEYPNGIDLVYVDYRDSYNEDKEAMERLAQTGYPNDEEADWEWQADCQHESIDYAMKEIFDEDEQEQIMDDDYLRETMEMTFYDIDTSDPINQLLKNTNKRYFYYDLDHHVEQCTDEDDVIKEAKAIAKLLRIGYKKHESQLREMVANAGYGGSLTILFVADPSDLFGKKPKYIQFKKDYQLVIMDRGNGSGWWSENFSPSLTFQFSRANLHDDEGYAGYSFSGDVCGMCKGDEATFDWLAKPNKTTKIIPIGENEEDREFAEREARYEQKYKEGGCTAGDMKMDRHANTPYRNDYPCGNKCTECGTFWID